MNKKEAIRDYKLSHRPMGVFQIRNKTNDKVFIDSSNNIPGKINRHKFALNAGQHVSKSLQADWNELGESAFEFETVEPLEPRDDPQYDYRSDLTTLEDLWLEKVQPFDERGNNQRKMSRGERLRMIAANRKV
jgi:hypothetical protein